MQSDIQITAAKARLTLSGSVDELLAWEKENDQKVRSCGGQLSLAAVPEAIISVEYLNGTVGYDQLCRNR